MNDYITTHDLQETVVGIRDAMKQAMNDRDSKLWRDVKSELGTRYEEMKQDLTEKFQNIRDTRAAEAHRQAEFQTNDHLIPRVHHPYELRKISNHRLRSESLALAHRTIDDLHILDIFTRGRYRSVEGFKRVVNEYGNWFHRQYGVQIDHLFEQLTGRALSTSGASGTAMFPTGFSAELEREIHLNLEVASLFREIEMPQNPYVKPFRTNLDPAGFYSELAQATASDWTDGDVTLTAKRLVAYMQVSDEADLSALFPMMSEIRMAIANSIADAIEQSIIDGDDTANNHQDSDVDDDPSTSTDCRIAYDGLRKLTHSSAKSDLSTFNADNMAELRKLMKRFGVPRRATNNLAYIVGISGYMQMLTFDELQTVEKYGSQATILTGEVGRLHGVPVIVSQFIREDLNGDGVYDGTTTNKTIILLAHRPSFNRGKHGPDTVETDRVIRKSATDVVATRRAAFARTQTESSTKGYCVAMGYNIGS